METKCSACGFVNPEGAGFCSLCGVPFIGPVRGPAPSVARLPNRVKGESAELDPETLSRRLDEDSSSMRTQEELLKELARMVPDGMVPDGKGDDDLDGLLSDYDGMAAAPKPAPPAAPAAPAPPRTAPTAQAASAARLAQALAHPTGATAKPATPPGQHAQGHGIPRSGTPSGHQIPTRPKLPEGGEDKPAKGQRPPEK